MGFWQLMVKKDDYICGLINGIAKLKLLFSLKDQRLLSQMRRLPRAGTGRETFIVLNGPSIKEQDLSVFSGKSVMFVNRGFKHPLYKDLKPEFHVFVDSKMINGDWPVTWLDEILELSPDVTFVMPVAWSSVAHFQPYIKKGVKFYWIPGSSPCTLTGVAGSCFDFAIGQDYKTIYFTGFDGTALAFELLSTNSHFYGVNEDDLKKTTKNYEVDLYMFSRHLRNLNQFADECRKKNISVINLTDGGLIDMFPRMKMSDIQQQFNK
jgi:hypothetical protein